MFTSNLLKRLAVIGALALLVVPTSHAIDGRFFARMKESLKVQRCGRERDQLLIVTDIFPGGSFTAYISEPFANGFVVGTLQGTWIANKSGRKLTLSLDAASESEFVESVRVWASDMCGLNVTVTSAAPVQFTVSINKPRNRASVKMRYRGTGFTSAGSGRATYTASVVGGSGVYFDLESFPLPEAPGP